jgi:hypothetical protein
MIPAQIDARLVSFLCCGIISFTAGAAGFAAEVARVVGTQVNDGYLIFIASAALTIGTGIFAYTFKLLLDVRTSQTRLEEQMKENTRRIDDMEKRR